MRSTRVSPSKFFGDRYTQYVDELTANGTIAGRTLSPAQRKEGFKKRGDKINFEKFVNKVLDKGSGPSISGGAKALPGGGRGGAIVKSSGVTPFSASPVSEAGQGNIDDVLKGIDAILETLRAEQKFKKKVDTKNRRAKQRERRGESEDKLEKKGFSTLGKAVSKVLKPVKSIFDRLFDFIFNTFLGRVLFRLIDWFSDKENQKKLDAIGRFLNDTWPALLAGLIIFGTGIGSFFTGLIGVVAWFLPKILRLTGRLIGAAVRNPMGALAVAGTAALGYAAYTGTQASNDPERAAQGKTQLDDNIENLGAAMQNFSFFSAGGRVPGTGTADTVPAMLTPGEFVMSRGAVSKYGVGFMQGINSSGGGGRTSKPGYYSSGGLVSPEQEPAARDPESGLPLERTTSRPDISAAAASAGTTQRSGEGSGGSLKLSAQQYRDLAFIVSAEARRNTDDEYGVAAAVLNRLADPSWPNTIKAVGEQQGQFAAVFDGHAYDDPQLAAKFMTPEGQAKIVEALKKLQGRTDFKGTTMYQYMGQGDIKFADTGNFFHYKEQVGKNDPPPTTIPDYWKKLLGPYNGPNVSLSQTTASGGGASGVSGRGSYSGSISSTAPRPKVKPMSRMQTTQFMDQIRAAVDSGPAPSTPSPGNDVPDIVAGVMQDIRKIKVLGIG